MKFNTLLNFISFNLLPKLDRPMSFEIRSMLKHYISIGYKSNEINVGTVSVIENKPVMNWNSLDSWEGLTGIE